MVRFARLTSGRGSFWGCGRLFVLVNCERFVNGLVGGWLLSVSGVSFLRFI